MSSSNPSAVPSPSPEKKRRCLSAGKKFRIYLEAQAGDKPVGELLRREGLCSTDLARIRQAGQGGGAPTPQRQARSPAEPGQPRSLRGHQTMNSRRRSGPWRICRSNWRSCEKNEWGFVGPITGRWLKAQTKLAILTVIETSQPQGVSARHSGSLLAIEPRRVVRWQQQSRQGPMSGQPQRSRLQHRQTRPGVSRAIPG